MYQASYQNYKTHNAPIYRNKLNDHKWTYEDTLTIISVIIKIF